MGSTRVIYYEYDDQNRITKITNDYGNSTSICTLSYNSVGDLISFKLEEEGYDRLITFSRNGNIITVTYGYGIETLELNAEELIVRYTFDTIQEDFWAKDEITFEYQGKNIVKAINVFEFFESGRYYSGTDVFTFTYDNPKSPFYHCNTPQWFFFWYYNFDFGVQNNAKTLDRGDDDKIET